MHEAVLKFFSEQVEPCNSVLECGGADVNGSLRHLVPEGATHTVVDKHGGRGVDVVADFAEYAHPEPVEQVWCSEVLEHAQEWREIVAAASRNLVDGGKLILTCAGPGRAPHGAFGADKPANGEWYENLKQDDLSEELARHFSTVVVHVEGLDLQAVAWK